MANELRHADVGTALAKSEWEAVGGHVLNSQAAGDIIYASTTSQLSRLAVGTANQILQTNSGASAPEWTTNLTIGSTVISDDSIVMTPSTSDTVTIAGATNGILNITTVDAAGTAADVNIDADGEIAIDPADAAGTIFKIAGTSQLSIVDGSITPTTTNDIDLGTASYQFKDAYIDGTLEADAYTVAGTALNEYIADTVGAMVSSNTESGITVAYEDGDNTLDFTVATLNQDTTGTATNATHVTVADNESTDENDLIPFIENASATGNVGLESDGDFHYNPSTGRLTATQLGGTLQTAAQTAITSVGTLTALTVDDVAVDGKVITMTGSASDTAVLTAGTNGTLSIVTTDAAAAAANIQITADGTVDIDSAGVLTLDSGAAINIEPAGGSAILLDGTISIDGGAITGVVSIFETDVKIGEDDQTKIDFETADEIHFYAGNENQLTLTDGALTPSSNAIVDLGTDALEFKDAYFDGTLEADAITIGGTNVVTGSLITTLGIISAGTWQGTAIAGGYIANNAIDSDHYADASVDFAHIQNVAANSVLGRNANSSGVLSEIALATTQILIGDGTGFTAAALSGDATMTNAGVVTVASVGGVTARTVGVEDMWVPASAMRPSSSNGCATITDVETQSGRPDLQVLDFDKDSDEFAQFSVAMPESWDVSETCTFRAYWTTASTNTDTVAWAMSGVCLGDNDLIDAAYATPVVATAKAASGTAEDLNISNESTAVTITNAAKGELVFFEIFRDVSVGTTHTADARLIGVKLTYTVDAATDA